MKPDYKEIIEIIRNSWNLRDNDLLLTREKSISLFKRAKALEAVLEAANSLCKIMPGVYEKLEQAIKEVGE